ncbi:nuclear transport factor 2 family protein [Frankia sp. CNm7]|uniref:Nuclear transport factor 2 family protein n=1 Tax=Frankia nepalensis TaxID=1836974 RepID=A0A937RAU0_9ACTN|nr:limonene-1,2-epoxide hydrolase family protein [Frankia nepalensis]MBL7497674.1 nuclear transport factor 2 family protein [Frankia nepalensis]MBL7514739.1 nuclear transport factor 2 family protein [Frankia nepalensis]MBL7522378.1 nuclear transport factor 2 family protein [Frankia nepalensis]MBL7626337.1 nuclear transport factor 2 family protein [Frankia nepalensis]
MPDPKSTVTEFLAALERLDIDAALDLVADDVVYQNVPLPPARGRAAVEKQLRWMGRYFTGFEVRVRHLAVDGSVVLSERTDVLRSGSWEAAFWVCGTFEVRDDRIVLWRDYFDWATFLAAGARGAGNVVAAQVGALLAKARGNGKTG